MHCEAIGCSGCASCVLFVVMMDGLNVFTLGANVTVSICTQHIVLVTGNKGDCACIVVSTV